jgi:ribosomal protein S12 methylthiotransferase accessory factor
MSAPMKQYSSSLRTVSIDETLAHARRIARAVGISRVTDITRLDRLGLPVFTSIRPSAVLHSLAVSAGKGLTPDEARIGAYMEAIELSYAEVDRARPPLFVAQPLDVLDGRTRPSAIYDFVPADGVRIPVEARLDCVHAEDVATGAQVIVPAEKALFPYVQARLGTNRFFSTDGNGLASGNTTDEATVHGLMEIIERDVHSFHNAHDRSQRVSPERLPPTLRSLVDECDRRGFDLAFRYMPSAFGIPVIQAILRERDTHDIQFGYGCHLMRSIAFVRAATEAAQSRLSLIHGGRDDLLTKIRAVRSPAEKADFQRRHAARAISVDHGEIQFDDIPEYAAEAQSLATALAILRARLAVGGLPHVLRVELAPPDCPIHVVRTIVPGSELFAHGFARIGRRLRQALLAVGGRPQHDPADTAR